MAACDELVAVAARYARGSQAERGRILDEFAAVTGYHREHAMRVPRAGGDRRPSGPRPHRRIYDDAVRAALVVLWGTLDRICGKRSRPMLPVPIEGMERHGHLQLAPEVHVGPPAMSAAMIGRAPRQTRGRAGGGARRRSPPSAAVRRGVPVRAFDGWDDPAPGFMEADPIARSGPTAKGGFVQTLTPTGGATSGEAPLRSRWTGCAPLSVREQKLFTQVLGEVPKLMPFALLGFDTDDDGVFLNETVWGYRAAEGIAFTRCRSYRKNDQAWVEQKNGAVVRHAVSHRRPEGLQAALARLYGSPRLFVNHFQPSFKLAGKVEERAKMKKRYHPPATPYQRLLADPRTCDAPSIRCGCRARSGPRSNASSGSPTARTWAAARPR